MQTKNPLLNLFKYTWQYSEGNRTKVVVFIAMSLVANSIQLLDPFFVSRAFNAVQFSPSDPKLLGHVTFYLSMFIVTTLVFWSMHGTSRVIENNNAFLVRKKYKLAMFQKVLALPIAWHKDHHSGDTIDKINKSSEAIYEFSRQIFIITANCVRLFGGIIAMSFFMPLSGVVATVIAIITYSLVIAFDKKIRKGYQKIFRAENLLASAIHDYVSNITTIITLRLKGRVTKEIDQRSMLSFAAYRKNSVLNEIKWFNASFLLSVMISSILIFQAYYSYKNTGVIVMGTLFALYLYLRRIGDTFFDFALRYSDMVRQDAAVRAAEVIDDEYSELVHKENFYLPVKWQKIEIKNLSFSYQGEDDPSGVRRHLDNINFAIEKGQRIALVGESGAGKSTLLALFRGLYSPDSAKVYCDGKIMPAGLEHIHEHVTLIPQDPEIFNSTIEDNITMETTTEQSILHQAIELAQFNSTVARLPKGLQTNVLEKGVSLSGGEKQRLALARGILAARGSEFLFMDEPTSSVDTENELKIYTNIFKTFSDKTIISSIHRLHLLRLFDVIYVFENGKIKFNGKFAELMKDERFSQIIEKYTLTPQ